MTEEKNARVRITGVKFQELTLHARPGAPPGSDVNAAGHPLNGRWFWKRLLKTNPELFSAKNVRAIKIGDAPLVDKIWVKKNPMHQSFMDDKLIHHHYDQGNIAIPLPERVHQIFDKNPVLHPNP